MSDQPLAQHLLKRGFDIAAALAGLLLLAPLLLLLAAWIKWDTPGPVFFRQWRIGRHGVPFRIYKFRTMAASAEAAGQLSLAQDERATPAGQLLRRHKLDELPQLINVLLGQMSLVGPRPEVPRYVDCYPEPARTTVLSVAPGITDWASIQFREEGRILRQAADPEQAYLKTVLPIKLAYYLRYVEQRSFMGDLRILFCTLHALLSSAAARRQPAPDHAPDAAASFSAGWPQLRPRLLEHGRLQPHDWQALLIALLRGLAALQVAAAHVRAQVFPGLKALEQPPLWYLALSFITGFAHQAVVIFFLLSGWLVGGSLLDRIGQPHAIRDYAIDRVTRLWIVLLPAFALMLLLGLGGMLEPAASSPLSSKAWSLTTLLGNLFGLQTMVVPPFGGNFPLWSLANETWYYILFPLLVISYRDGSVALRLSTAAVALLIAASLSKAILLYFTLWLMGTAASRIRIAAGRTQLSIFVLAFAVVAVAFRLRGHNDDLNQLSLLQDLAYGLLFLLCLCSAGGQARPTAAPVRWLAAGGAFLASFSFTLYILHMPLLQMLSAYRGGGKLSPQEPASLAVYTAMLAAIVALCYLFHLPFEAQTYRLRKRLKRWAGRGWRFGSAKPQATPAPGDPS